MEQTLLLIKPTAFHNETEILSQLKQSGFKISQVKESLEWLWARL